MGGPGSGRKPSFSSGQVSKGIGMKKSKDSREKIDLNFGSFNTPKEKRQLAKLRKERYGK